MPARPNVPKVEEVKLVQTVGEDVDVLNRFYLQYTTGPPSVLDLDTFALAIANAWAAHCAAQCSDNVTLTEVIVTDLTSPSSARGTDSPVVPGTMATDQLGAGTAFVLKRQIATRYRGGHPRVYLPWMGYQQLADMQTWLPAAVNAAVTAWGAFMTATLAAAPASQGATSDVSVSFFQGFTPHLYPSGRWKNIPNLRAVPVVYPVTGYGGNPRLGSQRRRNGQSR